MKREHGKSVLCHLPTKWKSTAGEKHQRLTQLCKMIFQIVRRLWRSLEQSAWKMFFFSLVPTMLLSLSALAMKHEHNEFKSHSKSILRSFHPASERLPKWSKNNFTSPCRRCPLLAPCSRRHKNPFQFWWHVKHKRQLMKLWRQMPQQTREKVNNEKAALRTETSFAGIKLICMLNSVTYSYIGKSMMEAGWHK